MFKKIISFKSTLLPLIVIIIIIHFYFLKDFWGYGFGILEDWTWLAYYSSLKGNLLNKFLEIWGVKGFYQGTMTIYVGLIDQFFPSNYLMIQVISFIGKITATILLFPAILALTRNKLLSFLGSLFFGMSYASYGSFITYTNSMEYWGISFLSLFVIYYKKLVSNVKINYPNLLLTSFFLFLALQFTYVRLLGLLFILIFVEILLFITKRASFKSLILRTFVFLTIYFIFITQGYDGSTATSGTSAIIKNITQYFLEGDLFVFLNPLAGLSLTLIPEKYHLLHSIPFVFITLIICSFILPVKTKRFLITSITLNCFLLIAIYFLASYYNPNSRFYLLPQTLSHAVFSSLIITISLSLGIEWLFTGRKNNLLFIGFIIPLLSLYFILVTWIVNLGKNSLITFSAIDKYLPIPSIAIGIFLASLFTMVLSRKHESSFQKLFLKGSAYGVLILAFFFLLFINYNETQFFKIRKSEGIDLSIQKNIQASLYNDIKNKGDRIVYYVSNPQAKITDSEQNLLIDQVDSWSYLLQSYNGDRDSLGCLMPITRPWRHTEALVKTDEGIFFKFNAKCPTQSDNKVKSAYQNKIMTMPLDNIFAFTLKDGQIIDITKEVKQELQNRWKLPY